MRKVARNTQALFEAGPNIYAVSMYQKIFKLLNFSSTIQLNYVDSPVHSYGDWFYNSPNNEVIRNDWDDLIIVSYRWSDRSESETNEYGCISYAPMHPVVKRYKDLPNWLKVDNWQIPLASDSPPSNFPYAWITSAVDKRDGCTVLACDSLGDVWEIDRE